MKIICISDTHLMHLRHKIKVPKGDVLVHAGDATFRGNYEEIKLFAAWFIAKPHKHKIFVPGNHDWGFEQAFNQACALLPGVHVLNDSGVDIDGVKFWGSPWQPEFMGWAFNVPRGPQLKAHWDLIPKDTNVLITHSPPYGIGDWVERGKNVGCEDLRAAVVRVKPKLHIFGHIHGGYGTYNPGTGTMFVNASICNEAYQPVNAAIVCGL